MSKRIRNPFKDFGSKKLTNEYGQELEAMHYSGHDFVELRIEDETFTFKDEDKESAAEFAFWLLAWARGMGGDS